MINELKVILQEKLSTIDGLSSGVPKRDDLIQDDEIYYGYEITYRVTQSTVDYAFNDYQITVTGRLVAKNKSLLIMDDYSDKIAKVLNDLRFKYTIQDVTKEDNICKKIINGSASMNEATHFIR